MKKITLVIFLLFLISACSSLVDKGDKLFESGEFSEAANFYERALERDPDNVEARLGLNRARFKIIDRGLIEVRMMRLSSNYTAAAEKLEQILRNQMQWNVQLDSAIASTQTEETRHATSWLLREADNIAQDIQYPDRFRWLKHNYAQLITNGRIESAMDKHRDTIWQRGKAKCQELAQNADGQRFYLAEFSHLYCRSWGVDVGLKTDRQDKSRYSKLSAMGNTELKYSAEKYRSTVQRSIDALSERFDQSPWFSPRGMGTLLVKTDSVVSYQHRSSYENRRASYTEEKTETVQKSDGEQTSKTIKSIRYYHYKAKVHRETAEYFFRYTSRVDDKDLSKETSGNKYHVAEEHNENFPPAKLTPTGPNLLDVDGILQNEIAALNDEFFAELNQRWEEKYCPKATNDNVGEYVLRCAETTPNDASVNRWFQQNFGLDRTQFISLYGIGDISELN